MAEQNKTNTTSQGRTNKLWQNKRQKKTRQGRTNKLWQNKTRQTEQDKARPTAYVAKLDNSWCGN